MSERTGLLRRRRAFLFLAVFAACTALANEQDFSYCLTCHGSTGNGNPAIRAPRIAGLEPWYARRQLEAFGLGWRGAHEEDAAGQEMSPVGARLADAGAIDGAVSFVQALQPKPVAATLAGDVERGRRLYEACASCHGVKGEGDRTLGAPALGQRWDWYLYQQLLNFRSAIRGAHPDDEAGARMRAAAAALPDAAAARDVIAYIATLQR